MDRIASQILSLATISKRTPWNYRYRLQDTGLMASIKKSGVLMPLLVKAGERPLLVAGHRRFAAARALGLKKVPVLLVGNLSPRDAFILNLVSNWRQACSEMDRVHALALAIGKLSFNESDVRELVMPFLGLPGDRALLGLYQKAHLFPDALKDLFEDGAIPFRGVAVFAQFPKAGQEYFAKEAGKRVRFTSSQILQSGEWLADLVKATGKDLETLFREHKLSEGLDRPGMDPRTKADKLFGRIKALRFPGYTAYLEAFEERTGPVLRGTKDLRIAPIEGFEEPGFEVQARVKTPADLDRLLAKLSRERSALNSLFDVVL